MLIPSTIIVKYVLIKTIHVLVVSFPCQPIFATTFFRRCQPGQQVNQSGTPDRYRISPTLPEAPADRIDNSFDATSSGDKHTSTCS